MQLDSFERRNRFCIHKYIEITNKNMFKKSLKRLSSLMLIFSMFFSTLGVPQAIAGMMCSNSIEVALVMDRSGSMFGISMTESKAAATSFVNHLGSNDKSALVSFASDVELENALTNDHSITTSNIQTLSPIGPTNIGGAIQLANTLFSPGSTAAQVEILFTDGQSNVGPDAIVMANEAASKGIKIFTIGLGVGVDAAILQSIADATGGEYYYAPTSAELEGIYDSISTRVCQLGSITGYKYQTDVNGNNQSIITGWNLTLAGDNYSQTISTDISGKSSFAGLNPGNYTLSEGLNPGIFEQTYPFINTGKYDYDIVLTEGQNLEYSFGNYLPLCGDGYCDIRYEDCSSCPDECGECELDKVTVVATKIVCDDEESLPNWGNGNSGVDIMEDTAVNFVAENPSCHLEKDWSFQVGDQNAVKLAGSETREGTSQEGWTTFGPTGVDGTAQTEVTLSQSITQLRLREVLKNGYIPFTYPPNDNPVSAEFYCNTDVLNYDNYDYITNLQAGETYYCVGFNALEVTPPPVYQCSDGIDNDNDGKIDYPADDGCDNAEDDDEYTPPTPVYKCSDGIDNDGDTLVDDDDPGCWADVNDPNSYNPYDDCELNDSLPQCSDRIDNDGDGDIDAYDLTCSRNGTYDPNLDNEENQKPVITVASPVTLTVADSFDPSSGYATAEDTEDGDITNDITVSSNTVVNTPGTYLVTYDVDDSEGLAADTKTLEVIVVAPVPECGNGVCNGNENCSTCSQDCGTCPTPPSGGGGGGSSLIPLTIADKGVCVVNKNNIAFFRFRSNKNSFTQVFCDKEYHYDMGQKDSHYGFPLYSPDPDVTSKDTEFTTNHEAAMVLSEGSGTYHCRVVAFKDSAMAKDDVTCEVKAPPVVVPEPPTPVQPEPTCPACNPFKSFIKLGGNNDPAEVMKLERFLNEHEGEKLEIDGVYELEDFQAVARFQKKHYNAVLDPWGIKDPTGYFYITTRKKANEIECPTMSFPLTEKEQNEVDWYRGLMEADVAKRVFVGK